MCFVGTDAVFCGYAISCLIVFFAFASLNFFYLRHQPLPTTHGTGAASDAGSEPGEYLGEGVHLAPWGVPSGGLNRNLSSSKLQAMDEGVNSGQHFADVRSDPNYGYGEDKIGKN